MRHVLKSATLLVATMIMLLPATSMAARYTLDAGHTYPNFEVSHLGFSVMHGRFNRSEGVLEMDRKRGTGALAVTIFTDSIDTGHDKRDEHLRGDDFFNVEAHPTIRYESTRLRFNDDGGAIVEGNLTMLGVTNPVTLHVDRINCAIHPMNRQYTCGFNATASLKRSDFGMKAYLPAVGDDIAIRIEAEAQRDAIEPRQRKGGPRQK